MIRDTKFLDLYGFTDIPANIINIAHQETQLAKYCNILNLMLRDYQNLTKSIEAVGMAIIKLRYKGRSYSGKGVSTDIVSAGIRAYLNAINVLVYKRQKK